MIVWNRTVLIGRTDVVTTETPKHRSLDAVIAAIVTLLIGLNLVWFSPLWGRDGNRYAIIHADDAGMCRSVNVATMDAMSKGTVSSASIIVPAQGFEEFATFATENPDMDFGIHLALTCETEEFRWPTVLPPKDVPSLLQADGSMWRRSKDVARHARIEEVEAELRAQIELAKQRGIRLSHLNHHMMVMFERLDLFQLYARLGVEYQLPVQFPSQLAPEWQPEVSADVWAAYEDVRGSLSEHGLPLLDGLDGGSYVVHPHKKFEYFTNVLQGLKPGVTEIVIHCADSQASSPAPPGLSRRQADYDVFTSERIREVIDEAGIEIIDWRQFVEMR